MRATSTLLALALTAAFQPAMADVVSLGFNDLPTNNPLVGIQLNNRYSTQGVEFAGAAWGVVSRTCNSAGWPFIAHDNSCGALLLAADADGSPSGRQSFTINFAEGFVAGSSFFYSASLDSGLTVSLFDGLNGTGRGTALSGFGASSCGLGGVSFCNWTKFDITDFQGVGRSMVVTANDQTFMLDDLNLVSATPGPGNVPEPASLALAVAALGALAWSRKRTAR